MIEASGIAELAPEPGVTKARNLTPYQALEAYRNIDDIKRRHEEERTALVGQLTLENHKILPNKQEIERIEMELREKERAHRLHTGELKRRACHLAGVISCITDDILRASPHDEMKTLSTGLGGNIFKKHRAVTFNGDPEALKIRLAKVKPTREILDEKLFDRSHLDEELKKTARETVEEYKEKTVNTLTLNVLKQILEELKNEIIIHDEKWDQCGQAINAVLQQPLPEGQAEQTIYFELQKMVTYKGLGEQQETDFFDPVEAALTIREYVEWSLQKVNPRSLILVKGFHGKKERKKYAKECAEYLFGPSAILEEEEPEQNVTQMIEQFAREAEDQSLQEGRSALAGRIEKYMSGINSLDSLGSDPLSWDEEQALKGLIRTLRAPIERTTRKKRRKLGLPIAAGAALAAALGGAEIFLGRNDSHLLTALPPATLATPDCPLPESFSLIVEEAGNPNQPLTWVYTLASLPDGYGAWELDPHAVYGQIVVICPRLDTQGHINGTMETVYSWDALSKSPGPKGPKPLARVKAGHFKVKKN